MVVRLQTRKRQLELIQMEEKETINDFTTRITLLVNQVKACGEMIMKQYVVAKILRSSTTRFDKVVIAIEESKDLAKMSKEELQSSLEAHGQRMERENFGGRESQNSKNSTCEKGESSCNKNGGQGNFKGERRRIDKSKMQCFVCQKFGHFSRECNVNKKEPHVNESKVAIARQVFNEENTLLVMIIEWEYSSIRLRDNNNNNIFGNAAETCCNRLPIRCNRLEAEGSAMMSMKGEVHCSEE
ncbi:uncharacterized protein LOC131604719 [Vicia villosa]|uniref:uncharacterized protein LOC131604719 n=1 Tax=Vicia villosa TaxID=3911 RepID=UPI00273B76E7|nr:uncharacterized protein LOC131604719 [Vicia villosa]